MLMAAAVAALLLVVSKAGISPGEVGFDRRKVFPMDEVPEDEGGRL